MKNKGAQEQVGKGEGEGGGVGSELSVNFSLLTFILMVLGGKHHLDKVLFLKKDRCDINFNSKVHLHIVIAL